ncbi:MAG: translation initiation factor IF-2 [Nitrospinae bacterium]|nr:translation initiation factor IF-2 [Nitrospinota bacterium]
MSNIRVYELANQLGIKSKDLIEELKKQGVSVKSHSSSIDEEIALLVKDILASAKKPVSVKTEKEPSPPVKPVEAVEEKIPLPEKKQVEIKVEVEKESLPLPPPLPVSPAEKDSILSQPKKKIRIGEAITVKELSEKLSVPPTEVIKKLIGMGIMSTVNQVIDPEAALSVVQKLGLEAELIGVESGEGFAEDEDKDKEGLSHRPPVVTIMGHVDHGKTSLLDAIRQTNVAAKEAGGITQHIGAYEVEVKKGKIVFLDTPGHEAFTAMRARGARVTDIVVLVVAADDGVMPQTIEAVNHAEAAGVPIIVAVNKIDKPGANPDKIKQDLSKLNSHLLPEDWGGKTIYVNVSAKKRTGIEDLLEMILLQSEIMELKANPQKPAKGAVIESKLDKGRGPVATVLIQKGTLRAGDPFIAGLHFGRVRAMINDRGMKVKEAGPSIPVEVLGLSGVPQSGDSFMVVSDEKKARQIALLRMQKQREEGLGIRARVTLEDLYKQIHEGVVKELNLVIKADVHGSIQAVTDSFEKLGTKDVKIRVIHGAVGGITETDIMLAAASNAVIIGFNVRPTDKAAGLAEKEQVELKLYTVIYNAIADVKAALEGLLEPTIVEKVTGKAEVRQLFSIPKIGVIAGCFVLDGVIHRNTDAKLIRDSVIVYQGKINSLRRFKEDAKEVQAGYECGIGIEKFQDIKVGDIIEPFIIEKIARKL